MSENENAEDAGATLMTSENDAAQPETQAAGTAPAPDEAPQDKQAADAQQKDDDAAAPAVPEKYEYSFDGHDAADGEVLDAFSEVARELKLSNEQADTALGKMFEVVNRRQREQIEAVKNDWAEASKADKEFGGEAFAENLAVAKKAMDRFATPELVQYMNQSGLGNHPEIIRLFVKVGKHISEDSFVNGNAPKAEKTAQSFYGQSNMNP